MKLVFIFLVIFQIGFALAQLNEPSDLFSDTCTITPFTSKLVERYGHNNKLNFEDFESLLEDLKLPSHGPARCDDAVALFSQHDRPQDYFLDAAELQRMSPRLLYNVANGCQEDEGHTSGTSLRTPKCSKPTQAQAWSSGILAALFISVFSLVGVLVIPVGADRMSTALPVLLALAVGALVGDAVLHLMPEALGVDSHHGSGEEDAHSHTEEGEKPYLGPACAVLFGFYFFYVCEELLSRYLGITHSHSHSSHTSSHTAALPPAHRRHRSDDEQVSINLREMGNGNSKSNDECEVDDHPLLISSSDHHGTEQQQKQRSGGIKPIGYLNLLADFLHNFMDGLGLGSSYSIDLRVGLATTIASLLHEIPQELGDFGVLLSAGFSRKQALFLNLVVSLSCLLGTVVGLSIGGGSEGSGGSGDKYVLAFTAGSFLYMAAADLIPEMQAMGEKATRRVRVMQQAALVSGFALMYLLAVSEAHSDCTPSTSTASS